jgi:glycerol-3-phosphate O-acyltransferase
MTDYLTKLENYQADGKLPPSYAVALQQLYQIYLAAASGSGTRAADAEPTLVQFLDCLVLQLEQPYPFELFHERVTNPVDYHAFGLNFFRPLIDFHHSKLLGKEQLETISRQLAAKENVILLANHQTEPDPQIINLLLENSYPQLGAEMIFVAGHRVTTDPMAIPFSLGRNLLCIFSKKYIDTPPAEKEQKLLHNQRTMKRMSQLLEEGGKCIYVAPSGGRDRPDSSGAVKIDPFDAQSIEMFYLLSKHAGHSTHFYPLALATYALTPPPDTVRKQLGEQRALNYSPVHLAFGAEIDMEHFPGSEAQDKKARRQERAHYIQSLVEKDYAKLLKH